VIDIHFHLLAGVDDGPATIEDSVSLARAAAAAGTRIVVATPHVSLRYPTESRTIERLVAELNERLKREEIALEVRAGAEIALTRVADIDAHELTRLRLGDGPWLLLEPPFSPAAANIDAILLAFQQRGNQIVVAHPERCPAFQREPQRLETLVHSGMLTSISAGSLSGRFGRQAQRTALELARGELIHNVASDAHDLLARAPGVSSELEQAGLSGLAEWLTEEVPAAILDGGEIPARPARGPTAPLHRPRRWVGRRR
jgi:protein-tyrosine phosphatase